MALQYKEKISSSFFLFLPVFLRNICFYQRLELIHPCITLNTILSTETIDYLLDELGFKLYEIHANDRSNINETALAGI